ncbi:Hypothetical protein D9617_24g016920 [Elsinoe fawcettii]|nr:Hypothetical protein D9617_24g016920 [Elsinoe fawcettii]
MAPKTKKKKASKEASPATTIARAAVAYNGLDVDQSTREFASKSCIANAKFSFRFGTGSTSSQPSSNVNVQFVFIASRTAFTVEETMIKDGPFKGFDPRPQEKEVFHFMNLPAEIRVMVYHELVVRPPRAWIPFMGSTKRQCGLQLDVKPARLSLNILGVSKQVRQEAITVLLGRNILIFDYSNLFPKFLALYQDHAHCIWHIRIEWQLNTNTTNKFMRSIANLHNLESLTLRDEYIAKGKAHLFKQWFGEQGLTKKSANRDEVKSALDQLLQLLCIDQWCEKCKLYPNNLNVFRPNYFQVGEAGARCERCEGKCDCHIDAADGFEALKRGLMVMLKLDDD